MLRKIGLLSVVGILLFGFWRPSDALTTSIVLLCDSSLTTQEALAASEAVFFGEIKEVTEQVEEHYGYQLVYEVLSTWKGPVSTQQIVHESGSFRGRAEDFVGKKHLVYAKRDEDGKLYSSTCLYLRPDEELCGSQLGRLGRGTPPLPREVIAEDEKADSRWCDGRTNANAMLYLLFASSGLAISMVLLIDAWFKRRRVPDSEELL